MSVSLCIPTKDRWSFLEKNLPLYLENPFISEIVISDENGNDARKIEATFLNPKLRVFVNDKVLGAFYNKARAVSLATGPWVCLMDSDNFAPIEYFQSWNDYMLKHDLKDSQLDCFIPSKARPQFDYSKFDGTIITVDNYKHIWAQKGECLFNTGNYIVPKDLFATTVPEEDALARDCYALDVQLRNYILLINGAKLHVVPGMHYDHVVHPQSFYLETCSKIKRAPYDRLYCK